MRWPMPFLARLRPISRFWPVSRFWPRVPLAVRDAYALAQYAQLARQLPLLYAALILIVFAAMTAANPALPWTLRHGVPGATALLFASRLITWLRRPPACASADQARAMLRRTRTIAGSVAMVSSVWCIHSWAHAPRETAMYFPLFMAMGAFATITCLSVSRSAALICIATAMMPMTLALLMAGDPISMAAGVSIATTCGFLVALLNKQHARTIDLLVLQNKMRRLAETDPLTGLANRRGFHDRLATLLAEASDRTGGPALILLDLDAFKPVNDRHGHAAGDGVLIQVAARLVRAAGHHGLVCRLGGDEFAVLVLPQADRTPAALSDALLTELARPFEHEGRNLHVGASLGLARWGEDGTTAATLFEAADRALYAAKRLRSDTTATPATPAAPPAASRADQAVRKAWVIG